MTQKSENVALVDMDGTLADFNGAMDAEMERLLGGYEGVVSKTKYDRIKKMVKRQPGFWADLKPMPLGFAIASGLEVLGFSIMILTKGPKGTPSAWTEKAQWCDAHCPPEWGITITQDKGLVYGKVLVDDWPPYIERWLQWRPRGVVLMPAQKWNKSFVHPSVHRICTAEDLDSMKPILEEAAQR